MSPVSEKPANNLKKNPGNRLKISNINTGIASDLHSKAEHSGEYIVPMNVRHDYETFINWCRKTGIKEIGHTVTTMISSKLRAKPINIMEFEKNHFINGSELDGSSFATGGGRVVNRSKVMAVPDIESKWFRFPDNVRKHTLYILSEMIDPDGVPMDGRKPLRLTSKVLEKSMLDLSGTLGLTLPGKNEKYGLIAGFEKEFFIIPKDIADKRTDIKYLGMTIVGGPGPINQNLQGVYVTIPKRKEEALLSDIVENLALVGITAIQKHMEVGQTGNELKGRQCEIVLKYAPVLNAADNELIARQIIEDVCSNHGFRALIGSKSFTENSRGEGINGSGKHTNLSLVKYDIKDGKIKENLLGLKNLTGEDMSQSNLIGLAIVAALGRHWSVYDASIASRGNDLRRKPGYEAPVYLSAFIGSTAEFRDSHLQDRNRSVSIGLSGDKLEWRAPGANTSMYYPLSFLQMGISEVLDEINANINKMMAKGMRKEDAIKNEYKRLRDEIDYFVVDEDVYELNKEEAEKRFGYKAPENTIEALEILNEKKETDFLTKKNIFSDEMIRAFRMVQLENYIERVRAEATVMSQMAKVLSNKVFRSDLMKIPSNHLRDMDIRLKERQAHLGKLNAELLSKVDGAYLSREKANPKRDLSSLIKDLRQMKDSEEMASLVVRELLPLLSEIRALYEEIIETIGETEEMVNF